MWIVKIGGSLSQHRCLTEILEHTRDFKPSPLIVPGGGKFADRVRDAQRRWQFNDAIAHTLAILAMRQYACLLAELSGIPIRHTLFSSAQNEQNEDEPTIWMPDESQLDPRLPRDWRVTSDSIAADLTLKLKADCLVLIKSLSVKDAGQTQDLADEYFFCIADRVRKVVIISAEEWLSCENVEDLYSRTVVSAPYCHSPTPLLSL